MNSKCPKCQGIATFSKEWKYNVFNVRAYKCACGNRFREYGSNGKLKFVLSEHDQSLNMAKGRPAGYKVKR